MRFEYNHFNILLSTGLQTSQDARFYAVSAKFEPFSNEGKTVVVQFTVKHEQKIDCGGGYVKIYPADTNQKEITGDTPYHIMFGKLYKTFLYLSSFHIFILFRS